MHLDGKNQQINSSPVKQNHAWFTVKQNSINWLVGSCIQHNGGRHPAVQQNHA
jgi:hypothetical protein